MSFTRPTSLPKWATSGTISIPSGAKQILGWIVEKPPFQFFNWLHNLTYQWLAWLDQGYRVTQSVVASGTTTLALGSVHVFANPTAGNQTIQLPDVSSDDGMVVAITQVGASGNSVTAQAQSGKLIYDQQTQVLSGNGATLTLVSFGGNWYLLD